MQLNNASIEFYIRRKRKIGIFRTLISPTIIDRFNFRLTLWAHDKAHIFFMPTQPKMSVINCCLCIEFEIISSSISPYLHPVHAPFSKFHVFLLHSRRVEELICDCNRTYPLIAFEKHYMCTKWNDDQKTLLNIYQVTLQ